MNKLSLVKDIFILGVVLVVGCIHIVKEVKAGTSRENTGLKLYDKDDSDITVMNEWVK